MATIRDASPTDAPCLLEIYDYYVVHTAISFECATPSLAEFRARMEKTLQRYPYLVIEEDGRIKGYAYAGPFVGRAAYDWACEMTIYLAHDARKRGLGRKLYGAIEDRLLRMGILNLYACIGYPKQNGALHDAHEMQGSTASPLGTPLLSGDEYLTTNSADFHRHLGYKLVGTFTDCGYKFGRWYDMVWMEKIIGEHKTPQPPVVPYPELKF